MKADGPRVHNRMDLFTIKEQLCAKEIFFVEDRKPDDAPDLQQAKHDEALLLSTPTKARSKTLQEVIDARLLRIGRQALQDLHSNVLVLSELTQRCPEIRSHLDRIPQLGATDQEILHWYQGLVLDMPLPEPSPHLDEARDSGSLS
ncbi:hypothetical protein FOZ62_025458 [Perkinsus olseni]|uniref:Uncharacterized protein n=1 Tax=Perkinsus olseni TaxID=32597 RepID=A0A7J6RBW2_PEROL|nr:hypothetical protein FOZ62_025458 [Perkinsus olseni]